MLKSRSMFEGASIRIGMVFSRFGINPNAWTIGALLPALIGFAYLYHGSLLMSVLFFFLSGFIDLVDGSVARVTGRVSNYGAFLDGIIDRYVEILLYIGLWYFLKGQELLLPLELWIILLTFGALMPTYVRAYADHRRVVTETEDHRRMGGLMERSERLNLLYLGMIVGYFDVKWLVYSVVLAAVLSNLTALFRVWFVYNFVHKA